MKIPNVVYIHNKGGTFEGLAEVFLRIKKEGTLEIKQGFIYVGVLNYV
jgi:hypothetical protein